MNLVPEVERCLQIFTDAAKESFGSDLSAIVLFGSAATGDMRATSDVNLMLVLKRFDISAADRLREPMRLTHAAVELNAMFLLEDEVASAVDAFAVKFYDIIARHRLLFGSDPFVNLKTSPDALRRRIEQVLLNLQLRLRERYVSVSLREEQLAHVIADAAPPLRSSAQAILQLENHSMQTSKLALEHIVDGMNAPSLKDALRTMSEAREKGFLPHGAATPVVEQLIELTQRLRERARSTVGSA
jgi:predicted nucleotidyltransferase